MTNPTSNYNFQMPTSTDLVTDLPADFEVFGQAVDTRLKALQPGTTLGDLAYSSATANTNTRLGIGTAGQVLKVNSGATAPEWGSISASPTSATNFVSDAESTTSGTFAGLTTAQTITMTTGTKVLVLLSAGMNSSSTGNAGNFSVAVSGATTRAATQADGGTCAIGTTVSVFTTHVYLTCTAGSNTFTMQYRSAGDTLTYRNRRMTVIDLGS